VGLGKVQANEAIPRPEASPAFRNRVQACDGCELDDSTGQNRIQDRFFLMRQAGMVLVVAVAGTCHTGVCAATSSTMLSQQLHALDTER